MTPIYGAAIKVIAGFYLGCTGTVESPHDAYVDKYEVSLSCEYNNPNGVHVTAFPTVVLDLKDIEITNIPRK